jgi:MFS family permease
MIGPPAWGFGRRSLPSPGARCRRPMRQGVGGGLLLPVGFTLVAQSAGPRRIGRALALIGVPIFRR